MFLGYLPRITKVDILASIPSVEHHPAEIFISPVDLRWGTTPVHYVNCLCKQIGVDPLMDSKHNTMKGDANTRNHYAIVAYKQAHLAITASRLLNGLSLPFGSQNMLRCCLSYCSRFKIMPAVLKLAEGQLSLESVEWGNKGVRVVVQRQVHCRPHLFGGKPFKSLDITAAVLGDVTAAGKECAQILSDTMIPIGLGDIK